MKINNDKILLIGSGNMAYEYLKVLKALNKKVIIVGRGKTNILKLKEFFPGFEYHHGGLDNYINAGKHISKTAINTVNIDYLKKTSISLLEAGVNNLLIEKPGSLSIDGLKEIKKLSNKKNATVSIAYNRRFYSSVLTLKNLIEEDGGVSSCHFEFTEWVETIGPDTHSKKALNKWILSNSSHVIDTVFFLIKNPKELYSKLLGKNEINWHPNASIFIGHGISESGVPFTYHSNWGSAGRWSIEILTKKRRFYLKPMEKLLEQKLNSVQINEVKINDNLDIQYKPGLFLQTKSFVENDFTFFLSIKDQITAMNHYSIISGY